MLSKFKESVNFNINQAKNDPLFNKTMVWTLISFILSFWSAISMAYVGIVYVCDKLEDNRKKIADLEDQLSKKNKEVE